jgi:uncharacterized protein DUF6979
MGNYGVAAVRATNLYTKGQASSPLNAWNLSTTALFGKGTSSQTKSCPRDAYLGLCESGLVKGIPTGNYTKSADNKAYAVTAAQLLLSKPSLIDLNNMALWKRVLRHRRKDTTKTHNQQMDVVRDLFLHHLLLPRSPDETRSI